MCSKESAYSREALEKIKNSYIKEQESKGTFLRKSIGIILRMKLLGFEL